MSQRDGDSPPPPRSERWIFDAADEVRRVPRPRSGLALLAAACVLGPLFGLVLPKGAPVERALDGLTLFTAPAVLAVGTSWILMAVLGGTPLPKRVVLYNLVMLIWHGLLFLLLTTVLQRWQQAEEAARSAFVLSAASMTWGRYILHTATGHPRLLGSLLPAADQSALALAAAAMVLGMDARDWALAGLASAAFLCGGALFLLILDRPTRALFGLGGLELYRYVTRSVLDGTHTAQVEQQLRRFAAPADLPVGVVAFRRIADASLKAIFAAPWVHPGPWGDVGGSNLPRKLGAALAEKCGAVLTFHGPSDHDQNPCASEEVQQVSEEIERLVAGARFSRRGSPMVRERQGTYEVVAQALGGGTLVAATSAPNPTDDIEPGVALAAEMAARVEDEVTLFVDAHNCHATGEGNLQFGDPAAYEMIEASRRAARRTRELGKADAVPRLGLAFTYALGAEHGIASAGISLALVETGKSRSAYVLFDANNLVAGIREVAREAAMEVADEAEVFTSDNHLLNAGNRSVFPAGTGLAPDTVREVVADLATRASADCEAVEVAMARGMARGVWVMGRGSTVRTAAAIRTSVTIILPVAASTLALGALGAALALVWRLGSA